MTNIPDEREYPLPADERVYPLDVYADLGVYASRQLLVAPTISGFSGSLGNNVISTKLEGGASRFRLDKIGTPHEFQAQWMLEAQAFDYLMAFYRTEISYGSLPFTVPLKAVDGSALGLYIAHIVPGTFAVTAYLGNLYQVGATLEIIPAAVDSGTDEALIAAGPGL